MSSYDLIDEFEKEQRLLASRKKRQKKEQGIYFTGAELTELEFKYIQEQKLKNG